MADAESHATGESFEADHGQHGGQTPRVLGERRPELPVHAVPVGRQVVFHTGRELIDRCAPHDGLAEGRATVGVLPPAARADVIVALPRVAHGQMVRGGKLAERRREVRRRIPVVVFNDRQMRG